MRAKHLGSQNLDLGFFFQELENTSARKQRRPLPCLTLLVRNGVHADRRQQQLPVDGDKN